MSRIAAVVRSHGFDVLVAVAAISSALEVAWRHDSRAPTTSAWFAVPAIALVILPLLGRERFPFAAPAAVWALAASLSFVDGRLVPFTASASVAGFVAAFLLGRTPSAAQARLGLVIVIAAAAVIVYNNPGHAAGQLVFTPTLFAIGWLGGFALRARGEQVEIAEARARDAEHEREMAARVAAAEERTRIARELHDIVAHAVSVMVLQVGSVRHHLRDAPAEHRKALEDVENTGRQALTEMRQLLGSMRQDGEAIDLAPQPGLRDLDVLLDQLAGAGLRVDLSVEGRPVPLPATLDLSAYRIIQEALTNVLRHAGVGRATVVVRYGAGDVEIEVRNAGDGERPARPEDDESGYGLIGVRERVKFHGGVMHAGPSGDGGYVLTTRLPLQVSRP